MSPEELRACRERAEAATPGALSVAREDEEHGAITYAVVRGGLTLAFVPEDTRGKWEHSSAKADAAFFASARADVLRLLATIAARDEEIRRIAEALGRMHEADGHAPFPASTDELVRRAEELTRAENDRGDARAALSEHRHAALFAAGIHGGPGAWRWASDPTGTILADEAAWERLLGEMRDLGSVEALRKLRWSVVANAGRLSRRGPAPRWAHVMSAAGLGSTSAKDLCVAAGFDPDEEVGSWPEPCETCAEEAGDEESEDE
jgi:hypothetical protein